MDCGSLLEQLIDGLVVFAGRAILQGRSMLGKEDLLCCNNKTMDQTGSAKRTMTGKGRVITLVLPKVKGEIDFD